MQKQNTIPLMFIAFLIMSISLWSCQWHTIEPFKVAPIDTNNIDTVYFSAEIQPIFDDKCNACHNNQTPKLTAGVSYSNLTSGGYVNTSDPESSSIITKITGGHYASYSLAEQTLILSWIQQGAVNN